MRLRNTLMAVALVLIAACSGGGESSQAPATPAASDHETQGTLDAAREAASSMAADAGSKAADLAQDAQQQAAQLAEGAKDQAQAAAEQARATAADMAEEAKRKAREAMDAAGNQMPDMNH